MTEPENRYKRLPVFRATARGRAVDLLLKRAQKGPIKLKHRVRGYVLLVSGEWMRRRRVTDRSYVHALDALLNRTNLLKRPGARWASKADAENLQESDHENSNP